MNFIILLQYRTKGKQKRGGIKTSHISQTGSLVILTLSLTTTASLVSSSSLGTCDFSSLCCFGSCCGFGSCDFGDLCRCKLRRSDGLCNSGYNDLVVGYSRSLRLAHRIDNHLSKGLLLSNCYSLCHCPSNSDCSSSRHQIGHCLIHHTDLGDSGSLCTGHCHCLSLGIGNNGCGCCLSNRGACYSCSGRLCHRHNSRRRCGSSSDSGRGIHNHCGSLCHGIIYSRCGDSISRPGISSAHSCCRRQCRRCLIYDSHSGCSSLYNLLLLSRLRHCYRLYRSGRCSS